MPGYIFNQFIRDLRNIAKPSLPIRIVGYLHGWKYPLEEMQKDHADLMRTVESIGAAMTPVERRNPRGLLESRRMELADACGLTDDELNQILSIYEVFAQLTRERKRQRWQEMSIHAMAVVLPLLFVAIITALAILVALP